MDKDRYFEERETHREILQHAFPDLGEDYEVIEPSTWEYNCIAHTLGIHDEWVRPLTGPSEAPFQEMDRIYADQGYQRSPALDFGLEPGTQKVVVFAIEGSGGTIEKITHAAVQDEAGTWESKLGSGPLIRHVSPGALCGPAYGEPIAVYVKSR